MAKKKQPSVIDDIIEKVIVAVEETVNDNETIEETKAEEKSIETDKVGIDLSQVPKKYWKNFNK